MLLRLYMKIMVSRMERILLVVAFSILFLWSQRAEIGDFVDGALAGYHKNKVEHEVNERRR